MLSLVKPPKRFQLYLLYRASLSWWLWTGIHLWHEMATHQSSTSLFYAYISKITSQTAFSFHHDNITVNWAYIIRDKVCNNNITVMDWPPCLPDMAPIGDLWFTLKQLDWMRCQAPLERRFKKQFGLLQSKHGTKYHGGDLKQWLTAYLSGSVH